MRLLTTASIILLCSYFLNAQTSIQQTFYFETDKHELTDETLVLVEKICAEAQEAEVGSITISGFTDSRGSDEYNIALSERRANAVREALSNCLPETVELIVEWKGENLPIGDNLVTEGRALNRRVEVGYELTAITEPVVDQPDPFADYRQSIRQSHIIDPTIDNAITGDEGFVFIIPRYAFKCPNGNTTKHKVKFEFEEYASIESMVMGQLSTVADKKLLESEGMVFTKASCECGQIHNELNKPIHVLVPNDKPREGFYTYYSDKEGDEMNWVKDLSNPVRKWIPDYSRKRKNYCYNRFPTMIANWFRPDHRDRFFCRNYPFSFAVGYETIFKWGSFLEGEYPIYPMAYEQYYSASALSSFKNYAEERPYYVMTNQRMGFGNIDQLLAPPPPSMVAMKVKANPGEVDKVTLIYERTKSIQHGLATTGGFKFFQSKKGTRVTIFARKKMDDGKHYYAIAKTRVAKKVRPEFEWKQLDDLDEFKTSLKNYLVASN